MQRLNLTSTDARTRIKGEINTRYRELATSLNLAKTRRTTTTAATVSGNPLIVFASTANVINVFDAVNLKRLLEEVSVEDIRLMDASAAQTGVAQYYAVASQGATTVTMMLYPKPNSVYNLSADVLAIGTDMTADGDVPTFPEDFHDILVEAVLKDELSKMEKLQYSRDAERKFEKRLSELRYFLAKRAYLSRRPVDRFGGLTTKVWPYGVAP